MQLKRAVFTALGFRALPNGAKTRTGATFCPHFLWMKWKNVDRIVDKGKKLLITKLPKKFNVD